MLDWIITVGAAVLVIALLLAALSRSESNPSKGLVSMGVPPPEPSTASGPPVDYDDGRCARCGRMVVLDGDYCTACLDAREETGD